MLNPLEAQLVYTTLAIITVEPFSMTVDMTEENFGKKILSIPKEYFQEYNISHMYVYSELEQVSQVWI